MSADIITDANKMNLEIRNTTQGIKGGNNKHANPGFTLVEILRDGGNQLDIAVDTFEGKGSNYKRREKELINISAPGFSTWSGTADELKAKLLKKV